MLSGQEWGDIPPTWHLLVSLVGLTGMLEPACLVAPTWIMVGPVNNPTFCIPFVHTIEGNSVPCIQRCNSGGQIDVVSNEKSLATRKCEDEALMTTTIIVICEEL